MTRPSVNKTRLFFKRRYIGVTVALVLMAMTALVTTPWNDLAGRDVSLFLRMAIGIATAVGFFLVVLFSAIGEWQRHHWRFGLGAMMAAIGVVCAILLIVLYS